VAVGELGTIIVSTDTRNWRAVDSGTRNSLRAAAWGNGTWVTVGDFGEIRTSTDAVMWTLRPTGYYHDLLGVAWGDGLFVAVGADTTILTSPDGEVWTLRASGNHPLRAITWGDGRFVAVGGEPPSGSGSSVFTRLSGRPLILTSENGVDWARRDAPVDGQMTCVAFGAGRFVAGTTSMRMVVSTNGHDWSEGAHASGYQQLEVQAVAWVQDRFLATMGSLTTFTHGYLTSSDGLGWTFEPFQVKGGVLEGRIISMATGPAGTVGLTMSWPFSSRAHLLNSADGRVWHRSEHRVPEFEPAITFAGGRFFLRESVPYLSHRTFPETVYLVSQDACHWESVAASGAETFGLPAYGANRWVAGGSAGSLLVSSDAIQWQVVQTDEANDLSWTAFINGRFIVTGNHGALLTSPDGLVWARQQLDAIHSLAMAQWSNGTYAVAESGGAAIWTSTDAMQWTRQTLLPDVHELETLLAWEEGFCALARTEPYGPAMLIRSSNGRDWDFMPTPAPSHSYHVAAGGGWLLLFPMHGSQTFYARRAGTDTWSAHRLPWTTGFAWMVVASPVDVAFGHDTFVLTRYDGILQSEPLNDTGPRLTRPLHAVAAAPESDVTFQAAASGSGPLRYQWLRNDVEIPGASAPFLTLRVADLSQHSLTVRVENDFGSEKSDPATVALAAPAALAWLPERQAVQVWGTPDSRYHLEQVTELGPSRAWSSITAFQIPSWGGPVRVKIPPAAQWPTAQAGFYRATFE
jgi:hypothetical protein